MHLDEDQRQRVVDGELPSEAEASVRQHLATCADCRRLVEEAEREIAAVESAFRDADGPMPPMRAAQLIERALVLRPRHVEVAVLRWAAGLLLAFGLGAAAYAMPGSPLPAWTQGLLSRLAGEPDAGPDGAPRPQPPDTSAPADLAGIAVTPGASLLIEFSAAQAQGELRVALAAGTQVVVNAPAGAATFSLEAGRLRVDNRGSTASFEIRIPRSAPRVEVRMAGRQVFLKDGARIVAETTTESQETYSISLSP